ncbi:MAG: DTW domain-containing protein [Bdellovibrionales bacterium]|nr:DTW domain-containing protein [Bdellovibrionales bacterium]
MYSCSKPRCDRCRMHAELCLCAEIPRVGTRARVVLVMHATEEKKPSNTGRLAHLCLPNSEIRLRGERGAPLRLDGLVDPEHETLLLRLAPESAELTPGLVAGLQRPVRLLVPDGTWSQASSTGARLARDLPGLRQVKLSVGERPSLYRLRAEHHPDGMSTFEAIARALEVLEGPGVRAPLERIFRVMVERVLWTRGKLPAGDVTGGLPGRR